MNKRMRELFNAINEKKSLVTPFLNGETKDIEKANALMDEIESLQKEFDAEERAFNLLKTQDAPTNKEIEEKQEGDVIKKFADAARTGFKTKGLNEGTAADGGYVVPEAIETQINTYKRAKSSLLDLVRVTPVKTNKGAKTFKARANQTGFAEVGEGNSIGAKATPTFSRVAWDIKKYAGYFPMTNEVLEDTDANLVGTLVEWIGDESRVTANKLIKAKIDEQDEVEFKGIDDMKTALNVTLGSAFAPTSSIVTNDNGLNYLDCLKDANGRYLLSADPANAMQKRLAVGGSFVPVKVYPNEDLPNGDAYALTTDTAIDKKKTYYTKSGEVYTKVAAPKVGDIATYYEHTIKYPFILGDLFEGIEYFDRKQLSIKVSDTAKIGDLNAFEDDLTLYRAIEREDVKQRDAKAFVNGFVGVVE